MSPPLEAGRVAVRNTFGGRSKSLASGRVMRVCNRPHVAEDPLNKTKVEDLSQFWQKDKIHQM